jgi:Fe-S-cluster containining protein
MIKTCPGLCCRTFPLNPSLEECIEGATAIYGYRSANGHRIQDDERVVDLLRVNPEKPGHYTCSAFDPVSGNCMAYEDRPRLCREYPYGRPCEYCTYDDCNPDIPGLPWPRTEDTGVFSAWEAQLCDDAA